MKKYTVITIDGPAGAGKSTVAESLARRLSFHYLDTGALYRAITLKTFKNKIRFSDKNAIARLIPRSRIQLDCAPPKNQGKMKVLLDGKDVSTEIREPWLANYVSRISSFAVVRRAMVKLQRKLARNRNIVCEGRDMGSVVFPKARIKFYLDASLKERTKRRYRELVRLFPGKHPPYRQTLKQISLRDYRDTHRKTAPLVKPQDSFYVDTTSLPVSQVLNRLMRVIRKELYKKQYFT